MAPRLSEEKTKITHIDEGVDFLGWRIQRHRKRGTNRRYIYWYPSRKAVKAITGKVKCSAGEWTQPAAGRAAAPAQSSAQGLVHLLPARHVRAHVLLSQ